MNDLVFITQSLIIVGLPYALWRLLRLRYFLPWVMIQICLGIVLGPSVLGKFYPGVEAWLFDRNQLAPLNGVAAVALIFFSFSTGLHLEIDRFRDCGARFLTIGAASILIPTALGIAGGYWIGSHFPGEIVDGHGLNYALAFGICTGVTALPVLVAILRELNLLQAEIGQYALGLAAFNDAVLWVLLAILLASSTATPQGAFGLFGPMLALIIFSVTMLVIIRPLLQRLTSHVLRKSEGADGGRQISDGLLIGVSAFAIITAIITQLCGLHYIFGAFAAGAIMPPALRRHILDRIEMVTVTILMPFFFMLTGLKTTIDLQSGPFLIIFCIAVTASVIGKVGGTACAARLCGETWYKALTLGALMQTKGLMEVVVLSVLLQAGLIGPASFSALVVMAITCTAFTSPLVRFLQRRASNPAKFAPLKHLTF